MYTNIHTNSHAYVHIHTNINANVHKHSHMFTNIHTSICTYVDKHYALALTQRFTHMYPNIHTHVHKHCKCTQTFKRMHRNRQGMAMQDYTYWHCCSQHQHVFTSKAFDIRWCPSGTWHPLMSTLITEGLFQHLRSSQGLTLSRARLWWLHNYVTFSLVYLPDYKTKCNAESGLSHDGTGTRLHCALLLWM